LRRKAPALWSARRCDGRLTNALPTPKESSAALPTIPSNCSASERTCNGHADAVGDATTGGAGGSGLRARAGAALAAGEEAGVPARAFAAVGRRCSAPLAGGVLHGLAAGFLALPSLIPHPVMPDAPSLSYPPIPLSRFSSQHLLRRRQAHR